MAYIVNFIRIVPSIGNSLAETKPTHRHPRNRATRSVNPANNSTCLESGAHNRPRHSNHVQVADIFWHPLALCALRGNPPPQICLASQVYYSETSSSAAVQTMHSSSPLCTSPPTSRCHLLPPSLTLCGTQNAYIHFFYRPIYSGRQSTPSVLV